MEDTEQQGPGIENGSEWSNGTVHFDRTGPTEKSGPPRNVDVKLFEFLQQLISHAFCPQDAWITVHTFTSLHPFQKAERCAAVELGKGREWFVILP